MSYSLLVVLAVLAIGLVVLRGYQLARMRRVSRERVGLMVAGDSDFVPFTGEEKLRTFPARYYFAPLVAALLVAAGVYWLTSLLLPYAVGGAILIGVITYLVELQVSNSRIERIEAQLADAIDLLVATLRAGSSLLAALDATLREAKAPLRDELENMVGRIRLGEDPRAVVRGLALRVPLESFRLFTHCLLVHWETGGSLAQSLRTVGRTVRDRLEISRRISAQAVESQISVAAVMAITYALALIMLNANPGPIKKLIYSQLGSFIAGGLIVLQAIGMMWIWRMSRIRF